MILIALGGNLPSAAGPPPATFAAALALLKERGASVLGLSPWYESAPVPASDQPWFVNGVASMSSPLAPAALLAALHEVEAAFGRVRKVVNGARTLDLDLLAYGGLVQDGPPVLPHPRLHERAFVLLPLRDLAPDWRHPVTGLSAGAMLARLPGPQAIQRLPTGLGP